MDILVATLEFLFGCHHGNLSRVFTLERQSYRVCCECGARFEYSWHTMSMKRRIAKIPRSTCLRIACERS
jgi:hypothetical protein